MISFEEALEAILEHTSVLSTIDVPLKKLSGFFLSERVKATFDLPMFDNSAVDGWGVKVDDVAQASPESPSKLKMGGTIQAGDQSKLRLSSGQTIKILTGARVVDGVEAIVMKEFCEEQNGVVTIHRCARPGENIRKTGEEYRSGQQILEPGTCVTPPVVGLLATLGYSSFQVHRKPKVAVIVTGNELVEPGKPLQPGQIYDSNSYALEAALKGLHVEVVEILHAKDNQQATQEALEHALNTADVVVSAGGVSVGDYDFVKDVAEEIGVNTVFWRIALKPGKPVYFGTYKAPGSSDNKLVFGLPGNPVSALVTLHELVKPALFKMMGAKDLSPRYYVAILRKDISKKSGRMEFVRGILSKNEGELVVEPVRGQESHMLGGLSQANCLIHFPIDTELLTEGSGVRVEMLSW